MQVGILGYGYVGQAVHSTFTEVKGLDEKLEVQIFDPNIPKYCFYKNMKDFDMVFVCVGTPMKTDNTGECDSSNVINALDKLVKESFTGVVVIKSTVPFRTLANYTDKLRIIMVPEFLSQNTYIKDSRGNAKFLIGGLVEDALVYENFLKNFTIFRFRSDYVSEICTLEDACNFKYIRNVYGAYQVLFWEMVQETTGKSRLMSRLLREFGLGSDMSQVGMDGKRGYDGACFPKDVAEWNHNNNHPLTRYLIGYNDYLKRTYNGEQKEIPGLEVKDYSRAKPVSKGGDTDPKWRPPRIGEEVKDLENKDSNNLETFGEFRKLRKKKPKEDQGGGLWDEGTTQA